jgi:hypothetical protein
MFPLADDGTLDKSEPSTRVFPRGSESDKGEPGKRRLSRVKIGQTPQGGLPPVYADFGLRGSRASIEVEAEAPTIDRRESAGRISRRSGRPGRYSSLAEISAGKWTEEEGALFEEEGEKDWCAAQPVKMYAFPKSFPLPLPAGRLTFGLELADVGLDAEEEQMLDEQSRKSLAAARVMRAKQANIAKRKPPVELSQGFELERAPSDGMEIESQLDPQSQKSQKRVTLVSPHPKPPMRKGSSWLELGLELADAGLAVDEVSASHFRFMRLPALTSAAARVCRSRNWTRSPRQLRPQVVFCACASPGIAIPCWRHQCLRRSNLSHRCGDNRGGSIGGWSWLRQI